MAGICRKSGTGSGPTPNEWQELIHTASRLVAGDKSLLAMDGSNPTLHPIVIDHSCIEEPIMKQIKKILAPTDLSTLARDGIRFAMETAQGCGAEVIVYHVIAYDDRNSPYTTARRNGRRAARAAKKFRT